MVFRFLLLGLSLGIVIFIFEFLIPRLKRKYWLHRELKLKRKRQKEYKKMMNKLEIK